jgi:hypothetical protein
MYSYLSTIYCYLETPNEITKRIENDAALLLRSTTPLVISSARVGDNNIAHRMSSKY